MRNAPPSTRVTDVALAVILRLGDAVDNPSAAVESDATSTNIESSGRRRTEGGAAGSTHHVGPVSSGWRVLISKRPPGVARSGWCEFPGWKIEPGESAQAAAVREAAEEVGLDVLPVGELPQVVHSYDHATVRLTPCLCIVRGAVGPDADRRGGPSDPTARPAEVEVAGVRWLSVDALPVPRFLEGNEEIIRALRAWAAANVGGAASGTDAASSDDPGAELA